MSDEYEIKKENGVYVVRKNGVFVKSFQSLEEARNYIDELIQNAENSITIKPDNGGR